MATDFSRIADQFRRSKLAEALRMEVAGNRLLVDAETRRVRGYFIAVRRGRLRIRIDGFAVVGTPRRMPSFGQAAAAFSYSTPQLPVAL